MNAPIKTKADQEIQKCLDKKQSFALIAGAGSGKTTSLLTSLRYIRENVGAKLRRDGQKIVCITYTNRAVEVISTRLDSDSLFLVSTLHKFLWDEIKRFNTNIRTALVNQIIPAHITKKREDDNGGQSKAAKAARKKVEALEADLTLVTQVENFRYNETNFSSYSEGLINHDDVIDIAAYLIKENLILRKILGQKYPYIVVDEAQDTFTNVVEALNLLCEEKGSPVIGYFGDPMQQIYDKRAGNFSGPPGTPIIPKEENFRCSPEVITLLNAFRKDVQQYAAGDNKNIKGSVLIRLIRSEAPEAPRNRYSDEQIDRAAVRLTETLNGWHWSEKENVKWLFLSRQMIARRMGFPALQNLFTGTYASSRAQDEFEKGEHFLIKPFTSGLCELVQAQRAKNLRGVLAILRKTSPAFDPKGVNAKRSLEEMKARAAAVTQGLLDTWERGTIKDILVFCQKNDLWEFSSRLLEQLAREPRAEKYDPELHESDKGDWLVDIFFTMRPTEIEAFHKFLNENTPFSTQHGVKGEQYQNVLAVFDDVEAGWNNYSFIKTLTPRTSGNPTDGQADRTQKLAYVCFSRAIENLRIILFTPNPEGARAELISKNLFSAEQIEISG